MTRNMDDKQRRAWDMEISRPIPRQRFARKRAANEPPAWWKGDEDAAREARNVMKWIGSVQ